MQHEAWLKDLLVFLVAAGLIVPLFHRARVGAVLGFLLIGVAVGPYGFGALAADFRGCAISPSRTAPASSRSRSSASCSCCS